MKYIPVKYKEPMREGEVPKDYVMGADGRIYERIREPGDPVPDPFEGNVPETETYILTDREEFYDFVTVCKACGVQFIAYKDEEHVRNFCPGCGKKLV